MEIDIFTEEQQKFLKKNYAEAENLEYEANKLLDDHDNDLVDARQFYSKILYLKQQQAAIKEVLEPFSIQNQKFEKEKEEIISNHGFSPNDFYDEDTIKDIIELKDKMREEVKDMSPSLSEITSQRKNDLEKLFDNGESNNKDNVTYREHNSKFK